MSDKLLLSVVTLETSLFNGYVDFVSFVAAYGEVGIYPGHAAFLSTLEPGPIYFRSTTAESVLHSSGGLVEIKDNKVSILADKCFRADEIDEAFALEAKKRAEEILKSQKDLQSFEQARVELIRTAALVRSLQELRHLRDKK